MMPFMFYVTTLGSKYPDLWLEVKVILVKVTRAKVTEVKVILVKVTVVPVIKVMGTKDTVVQAVTEVKVIQGYKVT